MRYQMVIQADNRSMADFDVMLALERKIEERLAEQDLVDGHDAGAGEWHIFLEVADPRSALARLAGLLDSTLPPIRVGYRELGTNEYLPLFPAGLAEFQVR